MEQSPSWETKSSSASQEVPSFLWKKVQCRINNSLPPVPILNQIYPSYPIALFEDQF
jgi:hypothetical protein